MKSIGIQTPVSSKIPKKSGPRPHELKSKTLGKEKRPLLTGGNNNSVFTKRSKALDFTEAEQKLAGYCKALSHPARIRILTTLAKVKSCVCGELVMDSPLAQATVSQHLKELREAKLIQGEISGTKVCYCLDGDSISELSAALSGMTNNLCCTSPSDCC